jgi:hypothetical protein
VHQHHYHKEVLEQLQVYQEHHQADQDLVTIHTHMAMIMMNIT